MISIESSRLEMESVGDRMFELTREWHCNIQTEKNIFKYNVSEGFNFDARSGGKFVDWFIPWTGNANIIRCWMVHDLNYYGLLSFNTANTLLKTMLLQANFNSKKTELVYLSLKMFGKPAWSAFDEFPGKKYAMNVQPVKKYQLTLNDQIISKTPDFIF